MAKEIVVKSVAFNVQDPDQLQMLQHANKRPNFSGYIKRLIQRDMEGGAAAGSGTKQQDEKPSAQEDRGLMETLI